MKEMSQLLQKNSVFSEMWFDKEQVPATRKFIIKTPGGQKGPALPKAADPFVRMRTNSVLSA